MVVVSSTHRLHDAAASPGRAPQELPGWLQSRPNDRPRHRVWPTLHAILGVSSVRFRLGARTTSPSKNHKPHPHLGSSSSSSSLNRRLGWQRSVRLCPYDRFVFYRGANAATRHHDVEMNVFHAIRLIVVHIAVRQFGSCGATLQLVTERSPKPGSGE